MKNFKIILVALAALVLASGCSSTQKKIGLGAVVVGGIVSVIANNNDNARKGGNKYEQELNSIYEKSFCKNKYDSKYAKKYMRQQRDNCNQKIKAYKSFKKSYVKLSTYRAKKFSKLQSVVNQRVFLQMKQDTDGLTKSEGKKLSKLIQEEAILDQQGSMYDSKVVKYQDELGEAQLRYNAAGGDFDLQVLVTYQTKRNSRY
jgi:hypothetical protein